MIRIDCFVFHPAPADSEERKDIRYLSFFLFKKGNKIRIILFKWIINSKILERS
jgi:hypothetical protein